VSTGTAAPRTPTEEAVAAIWTEVLALAAIGRDDDFFDIGGHSLVAAQIVARLQDAFGIAVSLRMLFDNPSVGALAGEIDRLVARCDPVATTAGLPGAPASS
jgi:acyl carrier protein